MNGSGVAAGALITLFGVVNCFFGYTYFRILLGVWGFLVGGVLGLNLASQSAPVTVLIAGAVGAVAGMLLIYFLFRVAIFLVGALLGYTLVATLLAGMGVDGNVLVLALVGAVIFGLLALLVNRVFIVVLTAFSGASAIITGVSMLLDADRITNMLSQRQLDPVFANAPLLVGLLWLGLAILGIMVQYRTLPD